LIRLLPKAATEAPSHREDPRAALLKLILEQRARAGIPDEGLDERDDELAALRSENERLRRAAGLPVTPTAVVDVVPPGEIADRDPGMRPGPDDPRPPTVIDVDAVDIRAGFDDTPQPWRQFSTDVEGNPLTARGRRY